MASSEYVVEVRSFCGQTADGVWDREQLSDKYLLMTPSLSADPRYARLLRQPQPDALRRAMPPQLFLEGDGDLIYERRRRASVVGARAASARGVARAEALGRTLAGAGIAVISGLADGIDAAGHRGAIAGGGRTIAFIGTALDSFDAPLQNDLRDVIGRDHLLVSQFDRPAGGRGLVLRNTTMAIWAGAAFVVEASARSGARHHVGAMLDLGREVYIHREVYDALGGSGPHWVSAALKRGARLYSDGEVAQLIDGEIAARGPALTSDGT